MLSPNEQLITVEPINETMEVPEGYTPQYVRAYILEEDGIYKAEKKLLHPQNEETLFEGSNYLYMPRATLIGSREPRWPVIRSLRKPREPTNQLSIGNQPVFYYEGKEEEKHLDERIQTILNRPTRYRLIKEY